MNAHTKHQHEQADKAMATIMARSEVTPSCRGKACFFCCKEPVYGSLDEVRGMLELLSPEEIEAVKVKVLAWREKFNASGLRDKRLPHVNLYRALNLWCPFLSPDGTCRVYDRRPLSCRAHFACESPDYCRDDDKRHLQKHALFPGLMEQLYDQKLSEMANGEFELQDNMGTLLVLALFGIDEPTASRLKITKTPDAMELEIYAEDEATPETV